MLKEINKLKKSDKLWLRWCFNLMINSSGDKELLFLWKVPRKIKLGFLKVEMNMKDMNIYLSYINLLASHLSHMNKNPWHPWFIALLLFICHGSTQSIFGCYGIRLQFFQYLYWTCSISYKCLCGNDLMWHG